MNRYRIPKNVQQTPQEVREEEHDETKIRGNKHKIKMVDLNSNIAIIALKVNGL